MADGPVGKQRPVRGFACEWSGGSGAITLANLRLYGLGRLSAGQAGAATAVALSANAALKLGIVRTAGGADLFRRCAVPIAASVVGAGLGVVLVASR